jgi:hypothetical protein
MEMLSSLRNFSLPAEHEEVSLHHDFLFQVGVCMIGTCYYCMTDTPSFVSVIIVWHMGRQAKYFSQKIE